MAKIQLMYLYKCSTFKTMGLLGDVVGLILSAVCVSNTALDIAGGGKQLPHARLAMTGRSKMRTIRVLPKKCAR